MRSDPPEARHDALHLHLPGRVPFFTSRPTRLDSSSDRPESNPALFVPLPRGVDLILSSGEEIRNAA
jgi:hypothetical protein